MPERAEAYSNEEQVMFNLVRHTGASRENQVSAQIKEQLSMLLEQELSSDVHGDCI